jgi:hypothetical protein
MINWQKFNRIKDWLLAQKEKAKVAWSIIVALAALLGYKIQSDNPTTPEANQPTVNAPDTYGQ